MVRLSIMPWIRSEHDLNQLVQIRQLLHCLNCFGTFAKYLVTVVVPCLDSENIAWDKECWKVTSECSTKIDGLCTNQEQADNRMFLHVKMTELDSHQNAVIISEDTNVFVLAMYIASVSNSTIYQKRGTRARSQYENKLWPSKFRLRFKKCFSLKPICSRLFKPFKRFAQIFVTIKDGSILKLQVIAFNLLRYLTNFATVWKSLPAACMG